MRRESIAGASRLYQDYLQVHKKGAKGLNLKDWGRVLGWVCLLGSLVFWVPIEWAMAEPVDTPIVALIALAFGCFMTFGPPVIVSIFVPGTRAGKLLLKLNALTPGKVVALGVGMFLIWHASRLLWHWWSARAAGALGMAVEQTILGVIFTIIAPALLFEPQSEAELHEELEQAHKAQVYEQATTARINLMIQARHNAEGLMKQGLENLSATELDVVRQYIASFVQAVDQTHAEWQSQIKQASGLVVPYKSLGADPRTAELFGFLGELTSIAQVDVGETQRQISDYTHRAIDVGHTGRAPALPTPVAAPAAAPGAPTAATMDRCGPQRPAMAAEAATMAAQVAEGAAAQASAEAFGLIYEALAGAEPFIRENVEQVLQVKRSKAGALIADWKTRRWVAEADGIRHHYVFLVTAKRSEQS